VELKKNESIFLVVVVLFLLFVLVVLVVAARCYTCYGDCRRDCWRLIDGGNGVVGHDEEGVWEVDRGNVDGSSWMLLDVFVGHGWWCCMGNSWERSSNCQTSPK